MERPDCEAKTMRKLIALIVVGVVLSIAPVATAGPFEDGIAAYQRGDFATALKLWRPLAEQGNAQAQNQVGDMYSSGKGVDQDYNKAVTWYRKAADQGYAPGQLNLGSMYLTGRGVTQDYSEAVKWFRKAADQGNVYGQGFLGMAYDKGEGVAQDYKEAARWYRLAAEQGEAAAQGLLGGLYQLGKGVAQDYKEAARWYRLAAEQGDVYAQTALGNMYYDGKGVSQNYIRAYMWFNLAAASGSELGKEAPNRREKTASKMTQAELSQAQALSRVCQQSNFKNCGEPEISPTANTDQTSARSVPMTNIGGTYAVPVLINNAITLNFVIDSGASDVSIPADVVMTLIRTGTLSNSDFIGTQIYRLADGSTTPSRTFRIRSLKVGERIVENVMGSVASVRGELLLGQSFLRRFKSWSIDNTKHALVLE